MMNYNTDSMNFTDKPDLKGTLTWLPRSLGQRRGFADTHTRVTRHIMSQGCSRTARTLARHGHHEGQRWGQTCSGRRGCHIMATGSSVSTTGEGPVSRGSEQRALCIPQGNTQRCGPPDPMPLRAMCTHTGEPRSRGSALLDPGLETGAQTSSVDIHR